jgi:hypothetical protein
MAASNNINEFTTIATISARQFQQSLKFDSGIRKTAAFDAGELKTSGGDTIKTAIAMSGVRKHDGPAKPMTLGPAWMSDKGTGFAANGW